MENSSQPKENPADWREVSAVWQGENSFEGINAIGNSLQMAGGAGPGEGISPMELLLIGLAGCTGLDIVGIMQKKRKDLQNFEVQVRGLRRQEQPRIYTHIHVNYELWGADLDQDSVEQAIQLSEEKYCSASAMLGAVAEIESSYQIHVTTPGSEQAAMAAEAGDN
jgi:putative redox protein